MDLTDTYNTTNGYSQPTTTSPPGNSNDYEQFGAAGRVLYELSEENKRLQTYKSQYEAEASVREKFERRYYEKCIECDDVKYENKLLKEENKLLKQQLVNGVSHSKFQYVFDAMDFNDEFENTDIERLMDICFELAETKLPKGYLVNDSKDVIPIYILLAERGAFSKHGDSDNDNRNWGATAFFECWNNNIVPRISDEKRREELLCNTANLNSALGKEPWKGAASCSWNRLYDEACGNKNGQKAKTKNKLGRAINIKKRLEPLLDQIPILKSKRHWT